MRKILLALCVCVLLMTAACKKVCYQCKQYCAYCVSKSDSSIAHITCANKDNLQLRVDSFLYAFQDSGFVCNKLSDQTDVCDNSSSIHDGITYYIKENYYCNPK